METKFKSQICTTREQSERLLQLGLKKETADMCRDNDGWNEPHIVQTVYAWTQISDDYYPCWSLHRLIEILDTNPCVFYTNCGYDNIIDRIEEYIKEGLIDTRYLEEGYFDKEYLV